MDKRLFSKERRLARLKYYKTKTWKRIRAAKLSRDPLCEYCRRDYRRITLATICDHAKPWNTWEEFVKGPFVSSCHSCHNKKTFLYDVPQLIKEERTKLKAIDI